MLGNDELGNQSAQSRPWETAQNVASFPFIYKLKEQKKINKKRNYT